LPERPCGCSAQKTPGVFFVWVNGRVQRAGEPAVSALDRGLLYGDGLFETLRAYDGVPYLLDRHLIRLWEAAGWLDIIRDVLDGAAIAGAIEELVRLNELRDAYVRITLTRGEHTGRLELAPAAEPTLIIVAQPLRPLAPSRYDPGSSAIIASTRQNADSHLPRLKTLNYLNNLLAKTEAEHRGADEAILLNTRGEVAEGASSNIFLVVQGRLITPHVESSILPGITRSEVLRLAREAGIPAEERSVRPDELRLADELFLTNSIAELVPIRAIEGHPVGQGRPGEVTRLLHSAYRVRVGQYAEAEAVAAATTSNEG